MIMRADSGRAARWRIDGGAVRRLRKRRQGRSNERRHDLVERRVLREARDSSGLTERILLALRRRGGQADDGCEGATALSAAVVWTPSIPGNR